MNVPRQTCMSAQLLPYLHVQVLSLHRYLCNICFKPNRPWKCPAKKKLPAKIQWFCWNVALETPLSLCWCIGCYLYVGKAKRKNPISFTSFEEWFLYQSSNRQLACQRYSNRKLCACCFLIKNAMLRRSLAHRSWQESVEHIALMQAKARNTVVGQKATNVPKSLKVGGWTY